MILNFNFHGCDVQPSLAAQLATLAAEFADLKETVMTTQAEAAASLTAVAEHVAKVGAETRALIAKVGELTTAVEAAGQVSPDLQAAIDAVTAQVKAVDDLVPDA